MNEHPSYLLARLRSDSFNNILRERRSPSYDLAQLADTHPQLLGIEFYEHYLAVVFTEKSLYLRPLAVVNLPPATTWSLATPATPCWRGRRVYDQTLLATSFVSTHSSSSTYSNADSNENNRAGLS